MHSQDPSHTKRDNSRFKLTTYQQNRTLSRYSIAEVRKQAWIRSKSERPRAALEKPAETNVGSFGDRWGDRMPFLSSDSPGRRKLAGLYGCLRIARQIYG
jgi:hypothetical protein